MNETINFVDQIRDSEKEKLLLEDLFSNFSSLITLSPWRIHHNSGKMANDGSALSLGQCHDHWHIRTRPWEKYYGVHIIRIES